jgi:signal transduction histidine kinase/CheY-like chemotaxis protein
VVSRFDPSALEKFFDGQPDAWFIGEAVRDAAGAGAGWRFLWVNAAWEKLTSKTRLEGEGQLNTDVFPGTAEDWLVVFSDMVDSGRPARFTRRTRLFAGWFDVSAFPIGGQRFAACFANATGRMAAKGERERAEAELQSARDLLANVFRQAPAYMCALRGSDHVFEVVNQRFSELVGGRDVQGLPVATALSGAAVQGVLEILDGVYRDDRPYAGANQRVKMRFDRSGAARERFLDFVCVPLHGADGNVSGVLFHGVDQTARKRAEDELRDVASKLSEMDKRKSDFLATLAHELRNPLAPLRNGLQILRMASGNAELLARARDMMERQVTSLVRLVDDLLDVARISGGKIEVRRQRTSLQEVIARAVETSTPALDAQGHSLEIRVPPEPILVEVDPTRVAQILANLLGNAAKYTPSGGRVCIEARVEDGFAVAEVVDNGVGIPQDALATIFDMFSQVKDTLSMAQGGLGIGLSLSRKLAELHGGTVHASSDGAGQGSRFLLRLPLAGPESAATGFDAAPSPGAVETMPARRLRVLVVDDNLDAGDSLATRLELSGHEARIARDGVSGLAVAREFDPDVAFLDIGMPGMNGYELAKAIRESGKCDGVTLVALTGWGTKRDVARSHSAGFDEHFTKPAQVDEVNTLIARLAAQDLER